MKGVLILLSLIFMAYAHQGSLDDKGGHLNHKTGKYHKHSAKPKSKGENFILKIFKYGSPHGIGNSFSSMRSCEREQARLTKVNMGLDFSYECVKK